MTELLDFLRYALDEPEYSELQKLNVIEDSESRQLQLKNFFHRPKVFNKIKPVIDPAWVSYTIYIHGKGNEI